MWRDYGVANPRQYFCVGAGTGAGTGGPGKRSPLVSG